MYRNNGGAICQNMKLGPKGAEYHVERVSRFGRMEGLDMDYAKPNIPILLMPTDFLSLHSQRAIKK